MKVREDVNEIYGDNKLEERHGGTKSHKEGGHQINRYRQKMSETD